MDIRSIALLASALSFLGVPTARAGDPPAPPPGVASEVPLPAVPQPPPLPTPIDDPLPHPEPAAPNTQPARNTQPHRWVGWLPAQPSWVAREEVIPAETCERQVPVYETSKVPVYEERRVPIYEDVTVPVFAAREVDVYDSVPVPEYGDVPVTVYETRSRPVRLSLPNPFSCECKPIDLKLWDRCEQVPVGTRNERGIVGWRTDRVVVGTRTETFQNGTESRQAIVGWRTERALVGEREETRCVGWRTESIVVVPAQRRVTHDCVETPSRPVTVTNGDPATTAPLPGTTAVVDEATFLRTKSAASR